MSEHCQRGHDQRQWQGPPETLLEVRELGIVLVRTQLGDERLRCHTALRTTPGPILLDFWMHRTGVESSGRNGRCRACGSLFASLRQVAARIRKEFGATAGCAEHKALASVHGEVRRFIRDLHPAYRIDSLRT